MKNAFLPFLLALYTRPVRCKVLAYCLAFSLALGGMVLGGCEDWISNMKGGGGLPPKAIDDTPAPPKGLPDGSEAIKAAPSKSGPPKKAVFAARARVGELENVPEDKPTLKLAILVLVDYEIMLEEARLVVLSHSDPDLICSLIMEIRERYTNKFLEHGKAREEAGPKSFRTIDHYVNRHKEILPMAKTHWIEREVSKYALSHPQLAQELQLLVYLINYANYHTFKKFDPERAKKLGIK